MQSSPGLLPLHNSCSLASHLSFSEASALPIPLPRMLFQCPELTPYFLQVPAQMLPPPLSPAYTFVAFATPSGLAASICPSQSLERCLACGEHSIIMDISHPVPSVFLS